MLNRAATFGFLTSACLALSGAPALAVEFDYYGLCDASAAIALDEDHFVVADDETNTLYIFKRGTPEAVDRLLLSDAEGIPKNTKEIDLEGGARLNDRIYWIASHSKDKGKRRRFFMTEIVSGSPPGLKLPASVQKGLKDALITDPRLDTFDMKAAAKSKDPEAKGALNIEGLAEGPDGSLLIGFRNPVKNEKALIVPLNNPDAFIAGKKAELGAPIALDLGNRGIRSLERVDQHYLIVAGPYNDHGSFALYRWSGKAEDAPEELDVDLEGIRPEALFSISGTSKIELLSDDGSEMVGGMRCKDLKQAGKEALMGFRSRIIDLDEK